MGNLAERTAIITGAGTGIGRALAISLAKDCRGVVLMGRRADKLAETAQLCSGPVECVAGDTTSQADVERLLQTALKAFGSADILIPCAAVFPKGPFVELSPSAWAEAVTTNLIGAALCCRLVLPEMLKRDYGRIVLLTSRLAREPERNVSGYAASKAGLEALLASLALEIQRGPHPNVMVNALVPGLTRSETSPEGQSADAVVPKVRQMLYKPAGAASGRVFKVSNQHFLARLCRWTR